MSKHSLPDFSDLKASSDYFYRESVELNDAVEDFIASRTQIPGLSPTKMAKLQSGLLDVVDRLYLISGLFQDFYESQPKNIGAK